MADDRDPVAVPAPLRTPTETSWGPGDAALASCRHAWGTILTASTRLDDPPPGWGPPEVEEARAMLAAARHLVKAVGEAIRRATDA